MSETLWPVPTLKHLCRLTDDCGVIQHAKYWLPDYATGYCTDDNSRALIVANKYYRYFGDPLAHELMVRYLAYLFFAQRPDGKMRNFMDFSRNFLEEEGSPDSLGRTLWALGHQATVEEDYLATPAQEMFHRALAHLTPDAAPHTLAYGLLGLCAYSEHAELHDEARRLARPRAEALLEHHLSTRSEDWEWFMPILTYGNGRLPQALLCVGRLLENAEMLLAGLRTLDFLNRISFRDHYLSVVGCLGWYPRGGRCALYDQQPIDAGAMVEANLVAYRLTNRFAYFDLAVRAMDWFYGRNILNAPLYDAQSGGCFDGLLAEGPNSNQGAESTLVYLMAQLALYKEAPHLFVSGTPELVERVENTAL